MFLKELFRLTLTASLLAAAFPLHSQVVSSVNSSGGLPIAVGAGFSDYDVDWGHGRMMGATLWADYTPPRLPTVLNGLAFEGEARDISRGHSSTQPPHFREWTAGAGVIYTWKHFHNFQPYGKFLMEYGKLDFGSCLADCDTAKPYTNDSRTVKAPGIGLKYRITRQIWARADYEYQFWPELFGKNKVLDPQGFTFGAMYDFSHPRRHFDQ